MNIIQHASLLPYNTFGINATSKYIATYSSVDDLRELLAYPPFLSLPKLPVGCGSNLLFLNDFDGVVLVSDILFIREIAQENDDVLIEVGSGVVWDDFVVYCVSKNYGGPENLSLIPGSVGASAVQNIGAYGVEAKDLIAGVHCTEIDSGKSFYFNNCELQYNYRSSRFKTEWKNKFIVTSVVYRVHKKPQLNLTYKGLSEMVKGKRKDTTTDLQVVRDAIIEIRRAKLPDPAQLGNAGSFFMNPIVSSELFAKLQAIYPTIPYYELSKHQMKIPAAWLIEQCGWKGKALGNAATHSTQPLVLVNLGNATGNEIAALAAQIIHDVQHKFEITLQPEVIFIT